MAKTNNINTVGELKVKWQLTKGDRDDVLKCINDLRKELTDCEMQLIQGFNLTEKQISFMRYHNIHPKQKDDDI